MPTPTATAGTTFRTAHDNDDATFVLSAFDSTLSHLVAIGSEEQWGTTPFSHKPERVREIHDFVASSAQWADVPLDQRVRPPWNRLVLALRKGHRVGAAGITLGRLPSYLTPALVDLIDTTARGERYLYLNYLVTHHGAEASARGVGKQLIQHVAELAAQMGVGHVFVDCWSGNGERLVDYYTNQGFHPLGSIFQVTGKHDPQRPPWRGRVLHMPIVPPSPADDAEAEERRGE